jgi:putative transposase
LQRKWSAVPQIVAIWKLAEPGIRLAEPIRTAGTSEQTLERWKKKYAGPEVDQVRPRKQIREEKRRLKRFVADLALDKAMRQEGLAKNFEVTSDLQLRRGHLRFRGSCHRGSTKSVTLFPSGLASTTTFISSSFFSPYRSAHGFSLFGALNSDDAADSAHGLPWDC